MLKVGDEVEILQASGAGAIPSMDKYLGIKTRVSEIRQSGEWIVLEDAEGWYWRTDWIRKMDVLKDGSEEI